MRARTGEGYSSPLVPPHPYLTTAAKPAAKGAANHMPEKNPAGDGRDVIDQVPPVDIEIERAVLGAMLQPEGGPEAVRKVSQIGVTSSHFYTEKHRRTLDAIYRLRDKQMPADLLTVTGELERMGKLEDAGGVAYLEGLIDSTPTAASVEYYADELKRVAARRKLIQYYYQMSETLKAADKETVSVGEIISELDEIKEQVDKMVEREGLLDGSSQRVSVLDGQIFYDDDIQRKPCIVGKGVIPGYGYTVLGGYTKEGKTSLSIQIALCVISGTPFLGMFPIDRPGRVLFIHLENPQGSMQHIYRHQVDGWGSEIGNKQDLYFWDGQGLSINRSEDRLALMHRISKQRPALVIIDPVSRLYTRDLSDYGAVRDFTEKLDRMGREFDCAFLVVHHFGKPGIVKRESVHAIIGSSAWGNFAASILGLDRYSLTRPVSYKKIDFLLREAQSPDPVCLYRNPGTLLFDLVEDPGDIQATPIEGVRDILKAQGKPVSFTLLRSLVEFELGLGEGQSKRLITAARNAGLIAKESGRYGKYFCVNG